jgi:hypothetical protein
MPPLLGDWILRLVAVLDKFKHAYLNGQVLCSQVNNSVPLNFLVDTGSTYTTILGQDSYKLGINFRKLRKASCSSDTAIGRIMPYELSDVELQLEASAGSTTNPHRIPLKFIHCLPPPRDLNLLHPINLMFSYSLLGMDVLQFFKKWQYTDTTLILQT